MKFYGNDPFVEGSATPRGARLHNGRCPTLANPHAVLCVNRHGHISRWPSLEAAALAARCSPHTMALRIAKKRVIDGCRWRWERGAG